MKAFSWRVYLTAITVAVISFLIAIQFSQNEWTETLVAAPIPVALIAALYQVLKDNLAFERKRILQNENNAFILSATSHMANVAFDKHVAFAEKYLSEVENGLIKIFCAGPTENVEQPAFDLARRLSDLRKEKDFGPWVTKEIREELQPFERALHKISARAHLLNNLSAGEQRSQLVHELAETYKQIADVKDQDKNEVAEAGVIRLKEKLQAILGIPELTLLRRRYIEEAIKRSND